MEYLERHEQQATDERLVEILESLLDRIPYIATGSLEKIIANFDKFDLDKEITDYIFKRDTIDDDSVQSFKLLAEETKDGGVIIMTNIRTQATNTTTSNAQTYTNNEFFWFTIGRTNGIHTVDTEYAVKRTTDYPSGKRVIVEKRHGVITEDRLQTLEMYLELGNFDDAFDPVSSNLLLGNGDY